MCSRVSARLILAFIYIIIYLNLILIFPYQLLCLISLSCLNFYITTCPNNSLLIRLLIQYVSFFS